MRRILTPTVVLTSLFAIALPVLSGCCSESKPGPEAVVASADPVLIDGPSANPITMHRAQPAPRAAMDLEPDERDDPSAGGSGSGRGRGGRGQGNGTGGAGQGGSGSGNGSGNGSGSGSPGRSGRAATLGADDGSGAKSQSTGRSAASSPPAKKENGGSQAVLKPTATRRVKQVRQRRMGRIRRTASPVQPLQPPAMARRSLLLRAIRAAQVRGPSAPRISCPSMNLPSEARIGTAPRPRILAEERPDQGPSRARQTSQIPPSRPPLWTRRRGCVTRNQRTTKASNRQRRRTSVPRRRAPQSLPASLHRPVHRKIDRSRKVESTCPSR